MLDALTEHDKRVLVALRFYLRRALNIPCSQTFYVEGWGWL